VLYGHNNAIEDAVILIDTLCDFYDIQQDALHEIDETNKKLKNLMRDNGINEQYKNNGNYNNGNNQSFYEN
jgi:hypothetical protein